MAGSLGVIGSVVGIGSGLSNIFGGGSHGGAAPQPTTSGGGGAAGQYDPYGPYRAEAASQLQQVMQNPALAMAQPGYQQQLQQGMQATERGAAATGQLQSGREQAALQSLGQNTFASFYNSLTSQLEQLSGASQAPAQANLAAQQAAASQFGIQSAGLGQLSSGLGGLANLYKGSQGVTPAGYGSDSTGAMSAIDYASSLGSAGAGADLTGGLSAIEYAAML
jgi:hypothetical protein